MPPQGFFMTSIAVLKSLRLRPGMPLFLCAPKDRLSGRAGDLVRHDKMTFMAKINSVTAAVTSDLQMLPADGPCFVNHARYLCSFAGAASVATREQDKNLG
jgi:hypothetical protein